MQAKRSMAVAAMVVTLILSGGRLQAAPSVSALTPQQIEQMDLVDAAGHRFGKVAAVVRSRTDGRIYVVVASGGVMGIGSRRITLALQDLRRLPDSLQVDIAADDLQQRPVYRRERYQPLKPSDRPISGFSAVEQPAPASNEQAPEPELDLSR